MLAHILIARRFLTGANRARNQIIVVEAGPRTSSWSCRSAGRGRRLLGLAANAPAQVLAAFQTHAADRKALLFTPTVALAHAMAATFQISLACKTRAAEASRSPWARTLLRGIRKAAAKRLALAEAAER